MQSNNILKHASEVSQVLTTDVFEKLINLLERHTGFSTDLIPQVYFFAKIYLIKNTYLILRCTPKN
jgi:hypothetical protein